MDTSAQADLFDGDPEAQECVSCGDSFVPEWDSHELCDRCYERKKRDGDGEWVERFYGER